MSVVLPAMPPFPPSADSSHWLFHHLTELKGTYVWKDITHFVIFA